MAHSSAKPNTVKVSRVTTTASTRSIRPSCSSSSMPRSRKTIEQFGIAEEGPRRQKFLHRLQGEITKRGVVDVLRRGVKDGPASVELFYATPSPGNVNAAERFAANVFSVTRQLHYSPTDALLSIDLCIFVNGLPVATFELKNQLNNCQRLAILLGYPLPYAQVRRRSYGNLIVSFTAMPNLRLRQGGA